MGNLLLVLFTRPFWLDEWHTVLVANRDSLREVISDLYRGSDFGPPLTHVVAWLLRHVVELTPVHLRALSLACVIAGMVLLFFTLRRRVDRIPALAGVLTIASHQLVVSQAFEWRFYAAWLLFACALAWALTLDEGRGSRRRDVAIAVASVLLVTSHWFGVITLGLMTAAAMATFGRDWRSGLRRVTPSAAGYVALAVCLPLVFGQRSAIVEKSWMPDPSWAQVFVMMRIFWGAFVPAAAVLVILGAWLWPKHRPHVRAQLWAFLRDPAVAALVVTAAMPGLLAIISLRQPALLPRYAITSLLAWTVPLALAVQLSGRWVRPLFPLVLVVLLWARVLRVAIDQRNFIFAVAAGQQALGQSCGRGMPVVFQTRHLMYPITAGGPVPGCDTRYLAISGATLATMYPGGGQMARFFSIENEFAALHQRLYAFPVVVTQAQLDTTRAFFLVGWDASLPIGYKAIDRFGGMTFPRHRITRVTNDLALFELARP